MSIANKWCGCGNPSNRVIRTSFDGGICYDCNLFLKPFPKPSQPNEEIAKLKKENEELREGKCEHVAQDVLSSDCKLCELRVAEKGYPMWVKKAKTLQARLSAMEKRAGVEEMTDILVLQDDLKSTEEYVDFMRRLATAISKSILETPTKKEGR